MDEVCPSIHSERESEREESGKSERESEKEERARLRRSGQAKSSLQEVGKVKGMEDEVCAFPGVRHHNITAPPQADVEGAFPGGERVCVYESERVRERVREGVRGRASGR